MVNLIDVEIGPKVDTFEEVGYGLPVGCELLVECELLTECDLLVGVTTAVLMLLLGPSEQEHAFE